jgi:hypothetical protein
MFKQFVSIAGVCTMLVTAFPVAAQVEKPQLACERGPVNKTYGKSQWLVYSCSDERTLVFISAPGSPAFPSYFSYFPEKGGYRLAGEGTGAKAATAAAHKELEALKPTEISALIRETRLKAK